MKAKTLDKKFDDNEDILGNLDLSKAKRLGVTRQSIIKVWLAERLEKIASNN